MCGSYFAISTPKKVSKRHFTCRFYLSTIAPALRYLKTLSPDGMPISPAVRYRFAVPVLPARASHLLSLLPRVFPSRRLPPRFSRRFPPAPVPIFCLPATPFQFAMFLPADRTCMHIVFGRRSMPIPADHWGGGYSILILRHGKRAECSMRVETSVSCDTESIACCVSPAEIHSHAISTHSQRGVIS